MNIRNLSASYLRQKQIFRLWNSDSRLINKTTTAKQIRLRGALSANDEARGNRKSAYQGGYKVTGNHIDYKDDTGFAADGDFKDGILYHAGMVLYREDK